MSFRSLCFMLAACSLFLSGARPASADVWGANLEAAVLSQSLSKIQRQIEGATLAALKTSAVSLMNSSVGSLIGGTSTSDSKIITDWQKYLYSDPQSETKVYMKSYINSVTGGKSSSSFSSDYSSYLETYAKSNLATLSSSTATSTTEETVSDPKTSVSNGSILAITSAYGSNMNNNPLGLTMASQNVEYTKYQQEQTKASTQAVSHGYKSVESSGKVILPGSTIGNIVSNANDVGNKIIAAAENPTELAVGVISTYANKVITNAIESGIGSIKSSIESEVNDVTSEINSQLTTIKTYTGTASTYTNEVLQQASAATSTSQASGTAAVPKTTSTTTP